MQRIEQQLKKSFLLSFEISKIIGQSQFFYHKLDFLKCMKNKIYISYLMLFKKK